MAKPFVTEGDLWLYQQEGGYAAYGWEVVHQESVECLASSIVNHFEAKELDWGSDVNWLPGGKVEVHNAGDVPLGHVRITIERIAEAQ